MVFRSNCDAGVPRIGAVAIDTPVLGFVVAVTLLSVTAFGLLPALDSGRRDPAGVLTGGRGTSGSRGRRRLRDAMVVTEVAASLVLLVGTGLMVRSFVALTRVDPGYAVEGTLTLRLSLPDDRFPDGEERQAALDGLIEELRAVPGVTGVGAISQLPLTGSGSLQPYAYDEATRANWESVTADQRYVTPGFFDAMGARLLAGREFSTADQAFWNRESMEVDPASAIIVDDRLAERAFGTTDAVGQLLQVNPNSAPESIRYARIVGVVEHLRLHDLRQPFLTQIYFPMRGSSRYSLAIRTSGDPSALVPAVRDVIGRVAPGAPVEDVRSMRELTGDALAATRLTLALMMAFGAVALLLACIGLYAVLAHGVAQRTREIGIRLALGQGPADVRRLVMRDGLRMVSVAVVVGIVAAALLGHTASGLIYGVRTLDPATYAGTCILLALVSTAAIRIPARRATRIDPITALRE